MARRHRLCQFCPALACVVVGALAPPAAGEPVRVHQNEHVTLSIGHGCAGGGQEIFFEGRLNILHVSNVVGDTYRDHGHGNFTGIGVSSTGEKWKVVEVSGNHNTRPVEPGTATDFRSEIFHLRIMQLGETTPEDDFWVSLVMRSFVTPEGEHIITLEQSPPGAVECG